MGNFLVKLAGARPEILKQCETERIKFQSIGGALLITSGVAVVSMWFALTSAMGINPFLAFPVAVAWGLVILGIDRWLVTSIRPGGTRRWAIALPRVILALLLGSLISTPFVLRIFQSEINNQVALIKEQRYSAFLAQQKNSQVNKQVTQYSAEVANLQQVISSGGQVPIDPSADKVVQTLTSQLNTETALENQYYHQWQCQLYGGSGCPAGNGPLAQASKQSYEQAKQQVATLNSKISAREQELQQTDSAHAQNRYQEAVNGLPQAKQELANAVAQQDALRNSYESTNLATNGLLIRLQALDQLTTGNSTLNAARILLFLLFLVIECLPVTVKLMIPAGNYEAILALTAEQELKDARRAIRGRSGPFTDGGAVGPTMPFHGKPASPVPDGTIPTDINPRAVVRGIWASAPETLPETLETVPGQATHTGEPPERTRLDETLRTMRDIPSRADSSEAGSGSNGVSPGGAVVRYNPDEL